MLKVHQPNESAIASPNFAFLAKHNVVLVRCASLAERYVFDDPNTSLIKLRQFIEVLAQQAAAEAKAAKKSAKKKPAKKKAAKKKAEKSEKEAEPKKNPAKKAAKKSS